MKRTGYTLVELLISISVIGILAGINVAILSAGFDSWIHSQKRLNLQQVGSEMMEVLMEGGFDQAGLKDGIELWEAKIDSIGFVPLWKDHSHRPEPLRNPEQRFTLEKQFKSGASIPIGQVKKPDSDDWLNVPTLFKPGDGRDPKHPDDVVQFGEPIPNGSEIQILYTPDYLVHPETLMRFRFDPEAKEVYRTYNKKTERIPKRMYGVEVNRLAFLYYDNLNQLFPIGQSYTAAEMRRITGVKIYLGLSKAEEWKELTSFTNVRNVQTVGVTISEGSILPLPSPKNIRAFSLGDLAGLTGDGVIELTIVADGKERIRIHLKFKNADRPSEVILDRFKIEAPPGRIRTSGVLNQTISRIEFVNLLGLDRTGFFDYDDDPDIDDVVLVKGRRLMVQVNRCDFDIAALFIRP